MKRTALALAVLFPIVACSSTTDSVSDPGAGSSNTGGQAPLVERPRAVGLEQQVLPRAEALPVTRLRVALRPLAPPMELAGEPLALAG